MPPRRYVHAGRTVEAMRFVGNGPDVAAWAGPLAISHGVGLSGSLTVFAPRLQIVEVGDWVVRRGADLVVVPQEVFVCGYEEVRHAHVE